MTKSIKATILAGIIIGIAGMVLAAKEPIKLIPIEEEQPIKKECKECITQIEITQIQTKIAAIKKNCEKDKRCENGQLRFESPGNIKNIINTLKTWTTQEDKIYLIK